MVGTRDDGKAGTVTLHRLLLAAPPGMLVVHRDGDPRNGRRDNLVLVPEGSRIIAGGGIGAIPVAIPAQCGFSDGLRATFAPGGPH